jgi:hypothetical protein
VCSPRIRVGVRVRCLPPSETKEATNKELDGHLTSWLGIRLGVRARVKLGFGKDRDRLRLGL